MVNVTVLFFFFLNGQRSFQATRAGDLTFFYYNLRLFYIDEFLFTSLTQIFFLFSFNTTNT